MAMSEPLPVSMWRPRARHRSRLPASIRRSCRCGGANRTASGWGHLPQGGRWAVQVGVESEAGALALYDRIRAAGLPGAHSSAGGGRRHLPVRAASAADRVARRRRGADRQAAPGTWAGNHADAGSARTLTGHRRRLQFQNKIRAPGPDLALIDHSVPAPSCKRGFRPGGQAASFCLAQKSVQFFCQSRYVLSAAIRLRSPCGPDDATSR